MKPWKVGEQTTRSVAKPGPARYGEQISGPSLMKKTARFVKRASFSMVILVLALLPLACTQSIFPSATPTAAIEPAEAIAALQLTLAAPTADLATPQPTEAIPTPTITVTPEPPATVPSPTPNVQTSPLPPILYYTQAGDTLKGVASRFNVAPEEITSPQPIPTIGLFDPGVLLIIPQRLGETSSSTQLIPDSEIVYSPSALDFDIEAFIKESGGYLSAYREWRSTGWHDGAAIIRRVSLENSINPRLLMVILEMQSHWVSNNPTNLAEEQYPIGYLSQGLNTEGLYNQLSWAVQQLNIGYYGWREGSVTELDFPDGTILRLAPDLNAGTVAVLYLFSRLYDQPQWAGLMYGPDGIVDMYEKMFGNPWLRAQSVEPLFPATLTQPPMELPFLPGHVWSFTGGPHSAWGPDGARAALDFAPSSVEHGCVKSDEWATAIAAGLVVRSDTGLVVLDLDGDGYEQTGWSILYLHVATDGRVPKGTWVNLNDRIGHPSCEGGFASGTHIHIARKYNGEWILADGPMPFNLSGWIAHADKELYHGWLSKDDQIITSSLVGSHESLVTRPREQP